MASASDRSVVKSIRDDFLTCHICFEVFTDPRILPCLHTYCFQCIFSHVKTVTSQRRSLVCPECREPITEDVGSLKSNFFINGLTDVVKEKSAGIVHCTACNLRGIESTAKEKCLDCGDYLCSSCSTGHNASSLTWKHEKISLYDIKKGTYDEKLRQSQRIKCIIHKEKDVEFYCESCSKSLCLTCVVLEHREHKCKTTSEAVSDKKLNILALTKDLQSKLTTFASDETKVKSHLQLLLKTERKEKQEIEEKAAKKIARINKERKASVEKLAKNARSAQKEYQDQMDIIHVQKSLLSNCVNFSDSIMENGKDGEVLMLEGVLTERLLHLKNLYTDEFRVLSQSDHHEKHVTDDDGQSNTSATGTACYRPQPKGDANVVEVRLERHGTYSVSCATDLRKPEIKGMVYSPKLGLVISDVSNCKIKIINKSGQVVQEITTKDFHPFAVAVAADVIGAVSENYLFLFTSEGSLLKRVKIAKQIPNKDFCFTYSLAASKITGFVIGNMELGRKLSFYGLDGTLIVNLDCAINVPLAALSTTPSGDIVLSEWGCGRLRVISPDGKMRFKVTEPGWKPNGTCVSKDGIFFVAEWQGVGIYGSKGKHLLDFTAKSVYNPVHVAVDENDFLYVSGCVGHVCVYKVHKNIVLDHDTED